MGNRYTKTKFTARQVKTLNKLRSELFRIYFDRKEKNDSNQSLIRLLRAAEYIETSLELAERWVE